jgi:hypothetical protein
VEPTNEHHDIVALAIAHLFLQPNIEHVYGQLLGAALVDNDGVKRAL